MTPVEQFKVGNIDPDTSAYLINIHGGHGPRQKIRRAFGDDGHDTIRDMTRASLNVHIIPAKIGHNTADSQSYQGVFDEEGIGELTLKGVEWACWNTPNRYGEIITILKHDDDPKLPSAMSVASNVWREKLESSKPGPEELIDFLSKHLSKNLAGNFLFYQPHMVFADKDPVFGLAMKILSRMHKVFPYEANISDHLNNPCVEKLFEAGEDFNGQLSGIINWKSVQKINNEFPHLARMGGSDSHTIEDIDLAGTLIPIKGPLTREKVFEAVQKQRTARISGIGERSLTRYPLIRAAFNSFFPNSRYWPVFEKWMTPKPCAVYETAQKAIEKWGRTLFTPEMQKQGWVYLDKNGQPQLAGDHFNRHQSLQ
ncbi:hypothetical protein A3D77_00955 [Candidatus Gottesmanbacteria bacterium RIFCSPHIGHO2_02_FULL_39_11]|uniref:Uncharacterized protein n=1 Tax=Candidatus Gottesmanbacteria bacterium RIFCSPHIGHO2_02_FULL_39_11 TaxID=1798382 RepID=A0A1F5ZNR7_9BACT|nr:MAG: hypothetical protein A3D77_00955 [Candidatus Gottesmanbacteria bacterium RIFCSPHIGHO2_02_FULL_39_11]